MLRTYSEGFDPQFADPHSIGDLLLREEPDEEEEDDEDEAEDEDEDSDEDGDDGYSE